MQNAQVKSIAECSGQKYCRMLQGEHSPILFLQYFRPSLSYYFSSRSLFCLFLNGRSTQVLLYCFQGFHQSVHPAALIMYCLHFSSYMNKDIDHFSSQLVASNLNGNSKCYISYLVYLLYTLSFHKVKCHFYDRNMILIISAKVSLACPEDVLTPLLQEANFVIC